MRIKNSFLFSFKNDRLTKLVSFFVILSLLFIMIVGCRNDEVADPPPPVDEPPIDVPHEADEIVNLQEKFDLFLDELFIESVTTDSISLNFALANPSAFGIEDIEPTFGEVRTYESERRDWERSLASQERLLSFDSSLLRPEQQITFDILARLFEISHSLELQEDHVFYLGYIIPYRGIQVQLPVLMTEFNFRTARDFEIYFALLEDTPRFFSEIIEFERERSRRGFFLSVENVDKILEQLNSFLENREDNFMITVINEIIDEFDGLSVERRNEYKERNRELVLNYFLPAYDDLVSALTELRGVGVREGGLANLPDGEEFSQAFLHHRTDSDMTLIEMQQALAREFDRVQARLSTIFSENPHLVDMFFVGMLGNIPQDTPENYMLVLEKVIAQDFPPVGNLNYNIVVVHESLQEHMGPAFYLRPAIDDYKYNSIYFNPARIDDYLFLFTVLAHEGFPGHMYQFVYFYQRASHPLRTRLTGIGYTEGWATYVEYMSYFWAGLDEAEAEILSLSRHLDLLFISIIDLNINAFGWGVEQVNDFFTSIGMPLNPEVVTDLYHRLVADPFNIIPYTIGYIELKLLLEQTQNIMGDSFTLLDFHTFFLDFGAAPFSLIRKHLPGHFANDQMATAYYYGIAPVIQQPRTPVR